MLCRVVDPTGSSKLGDGGRARALEVWEGLRLGLWSVVHQRDAAGRRFLLVAKNAVPRDHFAALSAREREVCARAATGQRDKEIAHGLGITLASVTSALHRIRRKIRVKTRVELAQRWRGAATSQTSER